MRKTITTALALLVVALCAKNHQQKQIITGLANQVTEQVVAMEALLDRVEQDRPSYVLDVLMEGDEYWNYMEITGQCNE